MADSIREAALKALFVVLQGVTGPEVRRNEPRGLTIPAGGLITLFDGAPGQPEVLLSPQRFTYAHRAEIVVDVQGETAAARDAALDGILKAIGAALVADTTLRGTVDFAQGQEPDLETETVPNGHPTKTALVFVTLDYTTPTPLG